MPGPTRRLLRFDRIDAVMPEVDRLLQGHTTVGQWTLAMICDHLARTIDLSLCMPPSDAPATRVQSIAHRYFFRRAEFPDGQSIPLPDQQTPDRAADPSATAEALRAALDRLIAHAGPWPNHPVIGPMTRDEWLTFHARHAAHHLGFAVPA